MSIYLLEDESSRSLQDISQEISRGLSDWVNELESDIKRIESRQLEVMEEYKTAMAQGDRSENAELTKAIEDLSSLSQDMAGTKSTLNIIRNSVKDHSNYKPVGKVVVYSAVILQNMNDKTKYVFKVFPKGVSELDRRIVDVTSGIGQAIMLKRKGDIVAVEDKLLGKLVKWQILDIY